MKATGLISRRCNRPSNNQTPTSVANHALIIIREQYADFVPTLACEKLRECHGISLAKETTRKLMSEAGLWVSRKLRNSSVYQPRNRRNCVGELIQIDGSDSTFSYFEATRAYIELHGKPQAFYSDKYSVFRINQKQATSGDGHTQFGRALFELNIESICANSSQAKGRDGRGKGMANRSLAPICQKRWQRFV